MPFLSLNLSLSLTAGMLAAFNPCGVILLPTYIAYLFTNKYETSSFIKLFFLGLKTGGTMTLGFLTIFLLAGIAISLVGNLIFNIIPQLAIITGLIFIILGLLLLINSDNFNFSSSYISTLGDKIKQKNYLNFYIYGIGYAVVSLGCTLPVFMIAVFTSFTTGNIYQGIINFSLYALGMGIVVTAITIFSLITQDAVNKWLKKIIPYINTTAAIFILITGLYLIYYWTIGPGNI
ncbi:MAG: cytochrome c biogenesis CcdA family protein [Bacillota bacterium]